jgi:hypothetical protein
MAGEGEMSRPSWIAANVVDGLQGIVAQIEAVFNASTVDAAKAAAISVAIATDPAPSASTPATTANVTGLMTALIALYNAIPFLVEPGIGVDPSVSRGLIALACGLAGAMAPDDAAAAFAQAVDLTADATPSPTSTPNRLTDAANAEIVARFARMVYLAAYTEALVLSTYATRAQAITARADCVQRFERELDLCGFARDIGVATALTAMRDRCVAYLTQAIINATPVLTVSAPIALPALWWAWRLYQDPTRAAQLISRNDVPTCEFMPIQFEALAA